MFLQWWYIGQALFGKLLDSQVYKKLHLKSNLLYNNASSPSDSLLLMEIFINPLHYLLGGLLLFDSFQNLSQKERMWPKIWEWEGNHLKIHTHTRTMILDTLTHTE